MNIEWVEDLAVGNPEIDSQHQELIKRVNDFWNKYPQEIGAAEVAEMLNFLDEYVFIHFNYEEYQMALHQFLGLQAHQRKHRELTKKLQELKKKFNQQGASFELASRLLIVLFRGFVCHIAHTDKELAAFFEIMQRPA